MSLRTKQLANPLDKYNQEKKLLVLLEKLNKYLKIKQIKMINLN